MAKKEKSKQSKMAEYKQQLATPTPAPQKKSIPKKPARKKEVKPEIVAPAPIPEEEVPSPIQIPRGERGDFLKTTITISAEMLTELRSLGMKRKSAKQKDTDTSALVREALIDFLKKNK